jgi:hypothetical protein
MRPVASPAAMEQSRSTRMSADRSLAAAVASPLVPLRALTVLVAVDMIIRDRDRPAPACCSRKNSGGRIGTALMPFEDCEAELSSFLFVSSMVRPRALAFYCLSRGEADASKIGQRWHESAIQCEFEDAPQDAEFVGTIAGVSNCLVKPLDFRIVDFAEESGSSDGFESIEYHLNFAGHEKAHALHRSPAISVAQLIPRLDVFESPRAEYLVNAPQTDLIRPSGLDPSLAEATTVTLIMLTQQSNLRCVRHTAFR